MNRQTIAAVAEAVGRLVPVGSVLAEAAAGVVAEVSPVEAEALAEAAAVEAGSFKMKPGVIAIRALLVIVISIALVGVYTGFSYSNLDVQFHDTYFVFDPVTITFVQAGAVVVAGIIVLSSEFLKKQHVFVRLLLTILFSVILFVPILVMYTTPVVLLLSK